MNGNNRLLEKMLREFKTQRQRNTSTERKVKMVLNIMLTIADILARIWEYIACITTLP